MITVDSLIIDFIHEVISRDAAHIIPLLKGKGSVNEFKLAEKLNTSVNHVRNILYGLEAKSLASFTRKKDKIKGWYVYYWALDLKRVKELLLELRKKELIEFQEQLKDERDNRYFVCPNKCIRMNNKNALESDFYCPECESILEQQDNKILMQKIEKARVRVKEEIEFINNNADKFIVKVKEVKEEVEEVKVKPKPRKVKPKPKPKKKPKAKPKPKKKPKPKPKKKKIIKNPIKLAKKLFKRKNN